jgi:hypothetical protein
MAVIIVGMALAQLQRHEAFGSVARHLAAKSTFADLAFSLRLLSAIPVGVAFVFFLANTTWVSGPPDAKSGLSISCRPVPSGFVG